MNNPTFIFRPEGIEDPRYNLVNKLKDMQNSVGRQYNPDQNEYWDLMREKIEKFTDEDIESLLYLSEKPLLFGLDHERIVKIIKSVEIRRKGKQEEHTKGFEEYLRKNKKQ